MTTPPTEPVERHTLYPAPHRVDEWPSPAPAPVRRSGVLPVLVVVGVIVLVFGVIQLGLMIGRDQGTDTPVVTDPEGMAINALQVDVGTCLSDLPDDGSVARVTAVPCDTPHRAEAVSSYSFAGDTWPGRDEVESQVFGHCGSFIQPGYDFDSMFKTSDWEDGLRWVAWLPTEDSWGIGERTGVCVAYRDADIVGSFVAGTATFTN